MRLTRIATLIATSFLLGITTPVLAQLAAPGAAGVSAGHVHLVVPDINKHLALWQKLGGEPGKKGELNFVSFPGILVLFRQGTPEAASIDTSANHIGFQVNDYAAFKNKLTEIGAKIFFESAENGQILADLPDGVRVEILTDKAQKQPIVFHHFHVMGADHNGLRDWYVKVFKAEPGERRNLPSAIVPGGRVDILNVRQGAMPPRGSKGGAIDHIGFEVADLNAFAAHAKQLGITFDVEPTRRDAIDSTISYITDPAGTYIEVTQGLANFKK